MRKSLLQLKWRGVKKKKARSSAPPALSVLRTSGFSSFVSSGGGGGRGSYGFRNADATRLKDMTQSRTRG